jgi:hypothetical protein
VQLHVHRRRADRPQTEHGLPGATDPMECSTALR